METPGGNTSPAKSTMRSATSSLTFRPSARLTVDTMAREAWGWTEGGAHKQLELNGYGAKGIQASEERHASRGQGTARPP